MTNNPWIHYEVMKPIPLSENMVVDPISTLYYKGKCNKVNFTCRDEKMIKKWLILLAEMRR